MRLYVSMLIMVLLINVAMLTGNSDRRDGKVYVHIVKQEGKKIVLEPIVPARLGFNLENGDLQGQKFLDCDQFTVFKTVNGLTYPTVQLRCSGIVMTLDNVVMTQPEAQ